MLFSRKALFAATAALSINLTACSDGDGVVLFSIEDDIALGEGLHYLELLAPCFLSKMTSPSATR
jgi:hypothetical protein